MSTANRSAESQSRRPRNAPIGRVESLKLDADLAAPAPTRRRRWLLAALILIGTGVAAIEFGSGGGLVGLVPRGFLAQKQAFSTFLVGEASSSSIVFDTSGFVRAKSTVRVSPKIAGAILEMHIAEGQHVEKGDLLAVLDDVQYRTDFLQAKANVALVRAKLAELRAGSRPEEIEESRAVLSQAQARSGLAAADMQRTEELRAKRVESAAGYDAAKARFEESKAQVAQLESALKLLELGPRAEQIAVAEAEVEKAQAALEKADYLFQNARVIAPISGTILKKQAELGETVSPDAFSTEDGMSTNLCLMADLAQLEAEVDIPERELFRISAGQFCWVMSEATGDKAYKASVERIMPIANRQRGVVELRVKIGQPDGRLLPEMNCRVLFLKSAPSPGDRPLVRIPREAVANESGENVVYVLDGELARRRQVELAELPEADPTGLRPVDVRNGLHSGEILILPEGQPLQDGQFVELRDQDR